MEVDKVADKVVNMVAWAQGILQAGGVCVCVCVCVGPWKKISALALN